MHFCIKKRFYAKEIMIRNKDISSQENNGIFHIIE